jgi:hypothetical protein
MTAKKSSRGLRILGTLFGLSLLGAAALAWPTKSIGIDGPVSHVVLGHGDRTMGLETLNHGGELVVRGSVTTTNDGTIFDAARRTQTSGPNAGTRPGGIYELDRAGLRVSAYDEKTHTVHLVSSGAAAPACAAAGLAAPCLVPRTKDLAFERLLTQEEFARTLTGSLDADIPTSPVAAVETPSHALSYGAGVAGLALIAFVVAGVRRDRRQTLLAQIQAAAKKARAATEGDVTLAELAKKVKTLTERAEVLDKTRQSLEARLATVDRAAFEKKKAEIAAGTDDEHKKHVLEVLAREVAETEKLETDLKAANAGLERILTALRVIPLSTRGDKNVRVKADKGDDVDAALSELDMRAEAEEEAARIVDGR